MDRRARRRRARVRCSPKRTSTPSRRGVRASGRSRGRPTARAIALCRNEDGFGRLVVVALDGDRDPAADGGVEGLAHRPRLGHVRASRASAPVAAPRPSSPCSIPTTGARDARSPGCARRARRVDLPEPDADHVARRRRRDGARAALAPVRRRRATPARHPPLLVDVHGGPTDQSTVDWKPRVRWFVSRGLGGAEPQLPGLDRVRPRLPPRARPRLGRGRRHRHRGRHPRARARRPRRRDRAPR